MADREKMLGSGPGGSDWRSRSSARSGIAWAERDRRATACPIGRLAQARPPRDLISETPFNHLVPDRL